MIRGSRRRDRSEDSATPSPQDGGRALGRGLRGSLDTPRTEVLAPGWVTVGGWVFHKKRTVTHVAVTFDGELVGTVEVGGSRPDVAEAHPGHASAGRSGWTLEVLSPAPRESTVEIRAYALFEPGESEPDQDGADLLGPMVGFAARSVEVRHTPAQFGALVPPPEVQPGWVEVTGAARHPAGLARVEVAVAGGERVLARHSLPGRVEMSREQHALDADLAGFGAFVQIPSGQDLVRIDVTVVGGDDSRVALDPLEVAVTPVLPAPSFSADRAEVLAARTAGQVRALTEAAAAQPPRVLVATHDLNLGGAQLYLQLLVEGLRGRGLDLCVVSGAGGPLLSELEALGVPVLVVGQAPANREQLESLRLQIASFAASQHVVGCLANTLLAFPAVSAVQDLGLPTSWAIHESFQPASFFRQYYGASLPDSVVEVALEALRECDEVVFEAEATRDLYAPWTADGASVVVPYGIDLAESRAAAQAHDRERLRAELGLRTDSRVLFCVGTVEPRKGQLALVRAFAALPPELRQAAELVLVGMGSTPYAAALRGFVERAGLSEVKLVEVDPDVLRWYLAADVLVSASDVESRPRTMLEAMALGRPVAATKVYGVGELVEDGVTGFTCEPLDLAALTDLLGRVLEAGDDELARLGEAARRRVVERHDPAGYIDHYARRLGRWLAREE